MKMPKGVKDTDQKNMQDSRRIINISVFSYKFDQYMKFTSTKYIVSQWNYLISESKIPFIRVSYTKANNCTANPYTDLYKETLHKNYFRLDGLDSKLALILMKKLVKQNRVFSLDLRLIDNLITSKAIKKRGI